MATPFEPEHDPAGDSGSALPGDDLLTDADTADGAAVDEAPADDTVPADDRLAAADQPGDDADEVSEALAAEGPKGLRLPEAGGGLTSDELRSDLGE